MLKPVKKKSSKFYSIVYLIPSKGSMFVYSNSFFGKELSDEKKKGFKKDVVLRNREFLGRVMEVDREKPINQYFKENHQRGFSHPIYLGKNSVLVECFHSQSNFPDLDKNNFHIWNIQDCQILNDHLLELALKNPQKFLDKMFEVERRKL